MLALVDQLLNSITMYRLVLYSLISLAILSILMGFFGILPFGGFAFVILLVLLLATCFLTQILFDRIFHAASNIESFGITALILFFILSPILSFQDILVTVAIGFIAIASKFILAVDKKHIFNPAAIAVVIAGLFGFGNGIWWVGSLVLLPFTIIIGLLIVRKIRRFHMLFSFLVAVFISTFIFNFSNGMSIDQTLNFLFASTPVLFLGTIMLTEPITTPPRKTRYMIYAAIVGLLYGAQFHIGPLFASPELALVIGNIFSYALSPKKKLFLRVQNKTQLSDDIYQFSFKKNFPFAFLPGQYLEWTVPHPHFDSRGNRRYFTIASSPTEDTFKIAVKTSPNGSSYKKALQNLTADTQIVASQLSGDFILPKDTNEKLVFIAGGIGITPFRSMIQYLMDTNEKRDIVLFYTASAEKEFVFRDLFDVASKKIGLKVVYVITSAKNAPANWKGEKGYLTPELLQKTATDYKERTYYLSGPSKMVESYKSLLRKLGISFTKIVTDYFPGF